MYVNDIYSSMRVIPGDFSKQRTVAHINQNTNIRTGNVRKPKDEKLYKVCEEFEAIFIKQMLNAMKKTINKSDFLHGGMAEDFFEDMLYDKYAENMAKSGDFGLARILYNQLSSK